MASIRILAAALSLAMVAGACPNQCSGHGRCGAMDICTCFQSSGGAFPSRFSWTGADCSQRTCPTGQAFDAISNAVPALSPVVFASSTGASYEKLRVIFNPAARSAGYLNLRMDEAFQVKIMSTSTDSSVLGTFSWKFAQDVYFQPETTMATSQTETGARPLTLTDASGNVINTGVYVWWDQGYKGQGAMNLQTPDVAINDLYTFTLSYNGGFQFSENDGNTLHQEQECSGRGTCDPVAGACGCFAGYTGMACERTVCPNDCSGHGTCQSLGRFVTDAGIINSNSGLIGTYAAGYARVKEFGCKCDVGYRGADCSEIECPSYSDPLGGDGGSLGRDCSGRGVCDYTSGLCNCAKGYYGDACHFQSTFM